MCSVVVKLTNSHPNQVALDNCHVKWTYVLRLYLKKEIYTVACEGVSDGGKDGSESGRKGQRKRTREAEHDI